MNTKGIRRTLRILILGVGVCIISIGVIGCNFSSRANYLAESNRSDNEQSEKTRQSIIDALEAQEAESLKALFSKYALENAEGLDELMDFYPGCNGGFDGMYDTHETTNYGVQTKVLNGTYIVTNDNQEYDLIFTVQLRNDEETEKIGLHLIEVMTEEAMPEVFKCKNQKSAQGVYVLE